MIALPVYDVTGRSAADAPGWMVTFADLLSLLLAFFVLLFAVSPVDQTVWRGAAPGLNLAMNGDRVPVSESVRGSDQPLASRDPGFLASLFRQTIDGNPALAGIEVERDDHTVSIVLPATITDEGLEADLGLLAPILATLDNDIWVTATAPVGSGTAGEAWLSALVAARRVARLVSDDLAGIPVRAAGLVSQDRRAAATRTRLVISDLAREGARATP